MRPPHAPAVRAGPRARTGPPSAAQVDAHRYAVRRLHAALVGRDPTLRRGAGRRQNRALVVGAVLAVLTAAGFGVVGSVRGDTDWRAQTIVRGEPSGTLHVVLHGPDRLTPALNLASARLLAADAAARAGDRATPADPVPVRDDALSGVARTAVAGIPGAPAVLPDDGPADEPAAAPSSRDWAVCDEVRLDPSLPDPVARPARATVVLGGLPAPGAGVAGERALGSGEALLARGDDGAVWLVADGRRARIDPTQGSVLRALNLTGARPRVAGPAFLTALPETVPLAPVATPGAGTVPTVPAVRSLRVGVGAVVTPAGTGRLFLVLATGVQEVSPVAAQLARFANPDPVADPGVASVPAAALAAAPRVGPGTGGVDTSAAPSALPRPVGYADAPVVCVRPDPAGGPATVSAATTVPGATPPAPVEDAPGVDAARVSGTGAYVRPVGSTTPADGVLVDPVGRAFPVPTREAAAALGLGAPRPAPRAVVDLLPRGPALDPAAARVSR